MKLIQKIAITGAIILTGMNAVQISAFAKDDESLVDRYLTPITNVLGVAGAVGRTLNPDGSLVGANLVEQKNSLPKLSGSRF